MLKAVLALAKAAPAVNWDGDMRHLPMIGHLPTSPFVTRYLVVKQDNNGDTFLVCDTDPSQLVDATVAVETTPGPIGSWAPPTRQELTQEIATDTASFSESSSVDGGGPPF
ncbi:hypothetical protein OG563_37825 [Nocardia vinacea]|uniref:Uncharacterized protein n=1 Tax=Nocardia vinacea TaxID=96468 RepID=A0ABZ1YNQ3_9NOCA|nr:hypothetical protein [Nocardia vinacea]